MTISQAPSVDQARLIADSFKSEDALIDTIVVPAITPELAARFLAKVEVADDGCLWWTDCLDRGGYGRFRIGAKTYRSHRVALAWSTGGIPAGYTAGHRCHDADPTCPGGVCDHRRCARPDHLVAESQRANLLAGRTVNADHAAKVKCPRGHILSGINLLSGDLRRGGRACRICNVVYHRAYGPVSNHGGSAAVARASGRRAVVALTGLETPTSIGLGPLQIHCETDLFAWRQESFDFAQVG